MNNGPLSISLYDEVLFPLYRNIENFSFLFWHRIGFPFYIMRYVSLASSLLESFLYLNITEVILPLSKNSAQLFYILINLYTHSSARDVGVCIKLKSLHYVL